MRNCEAEITFYEYGDGLRKLISDSLHEWMVKLVRLDNRFRVSGQFFDQIGLTHPHGNTLFGQIKVAYIAYLSPRSGEIETVEITVGHGANWMPVLAVASSNGKPVTILSKASPDKDMKAISEQVLLCFGQNDLDLR